MGVIYVNWNFFMIIIIWDYLLDKIIIIIIIIRDYQLDEDLWILIKLGFLIYIYIERERERENFFSVFLYIRTMVASSFYGFFFLVF